MDLMYRKEWLDEGTIEEGYLRHYEADFDITTDVDNPTNDFVITMAIPDDSDDLLYLENEISTFVYVDGSEIGGIITGYDIDIEQGTITYTGTTWRGLLSLYIIEPPSGQAYRVVASGTNLATALRALPMHPMISIQNTSYTAGRQYQYDRYIPVHEGATNMVKDYTKSLRLKFAFDEATMKAKLSVSPTNDRTSLIEMSQDYDDKVRVTITRDGSTPKHLICMGQGELADREIVHLYADDDWTITDTAISGAFPVDTYDYSGSDNLTQDGIKHFGELIAEHEQIEVDITDLDVELSDVIAARDRITGQYVTAEVVNIIWKCVDEENRHTESFEYKTAVRRKSYKSNVKIPKRYSINNVVSYYREPTLSMASTINGLSSDWTSFIFITDPHGSGNKQHSQAIALYLLDNTKATMLVFGGDYSVGSWNKSEYDSYMYPVKRSGLICNSYAVMGNHETFASGSYSSTAIAQAKQAIYNDFLSGKSGLTGSLDNIYYYFDDADRKIRYMFINTSDGGATQYTMTTTQVSWIANAVTLPNSTWSLLVIGHVNLNEMGVSGDTMANSTEVNASAIISAINGCNGHIIGYICGHQHVDITKKVGNFQHTTLLCDKFENTNYYEGISVTDRASGTVSEQAVTVVSINQTTKKVEFRRIGAGRNSSFNYTYS